MARKVGRDRRREFMKKLRRRRYDAADAFLGGIWPLDLFSRTQRGLPVSARLPWCIFNAEAFRGIALR
jgi:hypothetical protein